MTRLTDIPIRIEGPALPGAALDAAGGLGGGVIAILVELAALLERFAEDHEPAVIDLRSLPMSPQDRADLQRALGRGEVQATVDADGLSTVRETGVAGIWWVEHRDDQGELTAESLEVTRIPDFLATAPDEIAAGGRALRQIAGAAAARAPLLGTHAPARPHTT